MTTAGDILAFLETIAPGYMQCDWDNTGMLCGSKSKEVKKVLVALDPFESVCQEAVEEGVDLLLTHHPLIFQPTRSVTDETDMGRAIFLLIQNGITAINAHTNLDCAPGGVNDTLARTLGLSNIQVIDPQGTDPQWGLLRKGDVAPRPLSAFLVFVKEQLGCQGLRYVDGGKSVNCVAVGGGSCGSELFAAAAAGCDTFVTADIKYNQFRDAHTLGLNLIDAGHFHTENPVCVVLAEKLRAAFPEIQVILSKNHTDPMKFF